MSLSRTTDESSQKTWKWGAGNGARDTAACTYGLTPAGNGVNIVPREIAPQLDNERRRAVCALHLRLAFLQVPAIDKALAGGRVAVIPVDTHTCGGNVIGTREL